MCFPDVLNNWRPDSSRRFVPRRMVDGWLRSGSRCSPSPRWIILMSTGLMLAPLRCAVPDREQLRGKWRRNWTCCRRASNGTHRARSSLFSHGVTSRVCEAENFGLSIHPLVSSAPCPMRVLVLPPNERAAAHNGRSKQHGSKTRSRYSRITPGRAGTLAYEEISHDGIVDPRVEVGSIPPHWFLIGVEFGASRFDARNAKGVADPGYGRRVWPRRRWRRASLAMKASGPIRLLPGSPQLVDVLGSQD